LRRGFDPPIRLDLTADADDSVELALAAALERASAAGEWAAVAALANELQARRMARASSNVVELSSRKLHG
jgi:hypothetical protein